MAHEDILEYCLHHPLSRDPAGFLSIRMTAHPVGNTEEAKWDELPFVRAHSLYRQHAILVWLVASKQSSIPTYTDLERLIGMWSVVWGMCNRLGSSKWWEHWPGRDIRNISRICSCRCGALRR